MRSDSEHDRRDIPCITFGEYLIYKNKLAWSDKFSLSDLADKITEDDHIDYILNGWRFDDSFRTPEDYLRGCIEETAASEMNESWSGRRSKALDSKDIDNVLAVVYTILSTLHDNIKNALVNTRFFNYVRDVLTKDYFFTVLRFLYDMEIIEFVKPLDDTELDDFLYGFVISWDTPEELLRVRFEVLFIIGWATIQVNCILTT